MDSINAVAMLVAVGLGVLVGAIVLGAGMWLDHLRTVREQRELNAIDAPQDIVDRGHGTDGT